MENQGSANQNGMRKKYVVIMAAGSGTRMGGSLPKQFLTFPERQSFSAPSRSFWRLLRI